MLKPLRPIRSLKDCPTGTDRALMEAYLRTTYRVFFPDDAGEEGFTSSHCDVRIGQPLPAALEALLEKTGAGSFAIITAWNPRSRPLPIAENRARNQALLARLRTCAGLVLPALGIGDEGEWEPEESFLAAGLSSEIIVEQAQAFDQNAVVGGEQGGVGELWWIEKR